MTILIHCMARYSEEVDLEKEKRMKQKFLKTKEGRREILQGSHGSSDPTASLPLDYVSQYYIFITNSLTHLKPDFL